MVLKPREDFYSAKEPAPEDVLLIVEIADSSLAYDRSVKLPLFAAAGIPEVWIEDLKTDLLGVYLKPVGRDYSKALNLRPDDTVSPGAFPDVSFKVADLFG